MARSEMYERVNKRLAEGAKFATEVREFAEVFKWPPAATSGSRRADW